MEMTGYDMAAWVRTIHSSPQDFDEGDLRERLERHRRYRLMNIDLARLNPSEWTVCETLVNEYAHARFDTQAPPIVVDPYDSIIDGIHRVNAALSRGETQILAYVGEDD